MVRFALSYRRRTPTTPDIGVYYRFYVESDPIESQSHVSVEKERTYFSFTRDWRDEGFDERQGEGERKGEEDKETVCM